MRFQVKLKLALGHINRSADNKIMSTAGGNVLEKYLG